MELSLPELFLVPELFLRVLNMSITASYVIIFVVIARLFLKKAPKIFSYSLWAVVLFRLVCPFSFSAAFSFLKAVSPGTGKMEYIPSNFGMMGQPQIDTGISGVNSIINNFLPAATPQASVNPMQSIILIISVLWIAGVLMLLIYSVASYLLLKHKVRTALLLQGNIFECENISMPFVFGVLNPKIYLPTGLSETEKGYILKHEQTHIRRLDYIIKPLAFLALSVHWFNPIVWLSFVLMSRDMEMSCDEQVIKELGTDIKKDYSTTLLSLAVNRKMISGSPLAFGETGAGGRIKNVLNYKRPAFWVIIVAVIAVAAIGIGLLANPNAITFGRENNRLVVTDAKEKPARWERVSYFAPTAKQALQVYTKALLESDYRTLLSLTPAHPFDSNGQEIWNTIKINSVKLIGEDVRENKACYDLELDIKDGGNSAFEKGVFPRWLWLVKGEQGWYAEGLMTSGVPDLNWWISENKKIDEISVKDLTEKTIITVERFKNTKYPLIAELSQEDIYLYGMKPTGVVLKYGDKIQLFDWRYTTPRFILPVLKNYDIDNDGKDEIICVLNVDSGTGISIYELHILKPDRTSCYVDYKFSDYLAQVKAMLSFTYNKDKNSILLKTNNNSYTYALPTEYQKLTFKNVSYGDIVTFDISNGLQINIPLGVIFDEFVSPMFLRDIEFKGDIAFENGKYQITGSQITND